MALSRIAAVMIENMADAATISASSQVSSAPVTRLQQEHLARRWRSAAEPASVLLDLGSSRSLDTIWVGGLTATKVRWRVSTADATGAAGDAYDSGGTLEDVDQAYGQAVKLLEAPVTGRYVRIDLEHGSLTYVEAGRVACGLRNTFHFNMAYGFEVTHVDPSRVDTSLGGQDTVDPRPIYREMMATFPDVSEADAAGFLRTMARVNGIRTDVLFIADPGGNDLAHDTLWGRVAESTPLVRARLDSLSKTLRIRERR
jgi:hypothetical protein